MQFTLPLTENLHCEIEIRISRRGATVVNNILGVVFCLALICGQPGLLAALFLVAGAALTGLSIIVASFHGLEVLRRTPVSTILSMHFWKPKRA